jgi:hypothetical protein
VSGPKHQYVSPLRKADAVFTNLDPISNCVAKKLVQLALAPSSPRDLRASAFRRSRGHA